MHHAIVRLAFAEPFDNYHSSYTFCCYLYDFCKTYKRQKKRQILMRVRLLVLPNVGNLP